MYFAGCAERNFQDQLRIRLEWSYPPSDGTSVDFNAAQEEEMMPPALKELAWPVPCYNFTFRTDKAGQTRLIKKSMEHPASRGR